MRARKLLLSVVCAMLLGCVGGTEGATDGGTEGSTESATDGATDGGTEGGTDGGIEEAPVLELSLSQVKQFDFEWSAVAGAQYYQLLESVDVGEPYVQVGEDVFGLSTSLTVPLHFRLNASYKLRACNADGCTESEVVDVEGPLVEAIGYFKASNPSPEYPPLFSSQPVNFGFDVALSQDGNTLAVGANGESSCATGIDGNQSNDYVHCFLAGAVYVFVRDGQNAWSQQAYVKASNTNGFDWFGGAVALSKDGNTLAVGALGEGSLATGIDGDQTQIDDQAQIDPFDVWTTGGSAGAVYVFVRDGQNAWSQQAYVKASNTALGDWFGAAVALSKDGNTLAVGASAEASIATGIDGDQTDDSCLFAGAVYVFVRDGQNAWSQQAYVKASNTTSGNPPWGDHFGDSVELSEDGSTMVVGAPWEDSGAMGIGGNDADNSIEDVGAAYVFVRDGQDAWSQQAYVKPSNPGMWQNFPNNVGLSNDGNTMAIGASGEGDDGAAYVFVRDGQNAWSQQARIPHPDPDPDPEYLYDYFGADVALSADGNIMAVGNTGGGDSGAMGIGALHSSGAGYVFVRDDQNAWSQQAYVKASNSGGYFGNSVALSGNGNTLAVGAPEESSSSAGIGGNQADNSYPTAGAVYLY
jgi:hypothetical protein